MPVIHVEHGGGRALQQTADGFTRGASAIMRGNQIANQDEALQLRRQAVETDVLLREARANKLKQELDLAEREEQLRQKEAEEIRSRISPERLSDPTALLPSLHAESQVGADTSSLAWTDAEIESYAEAVEAEKGEEWLEARREQRSEALQGLEMSHVAEFATNLIQAGYPEEVIAPIQMAMSAEGEGETISPIEAHRQMLLAADDWEDDQTALGISEQIASKISGMVPEANEQSLVLSALQKARRPRRPGEDLATYERQLKNHLFDATVAAFGLEQAVAAREEAAREEGVRTWREGAEKMQEAFRGPTQAKPNAKPAAPQGDVEGALEGAQAMLEDLPRDASDSDKRKAINAFAKKAGIPVRALIEAMRESQKKKAEARAYFGKLFSGASMQEGQRGSFRGYEEAGLTLPVNFRP